METAYRYIRRSILSSAFSDGRRLNYRELGHRLQMSKTPIILALSRLVKEGLVRYRKNHGYFVDASKVMEMTPEDSLEFNPESGDLSNDRLMGLSLNDSVYEQIKSLVASFKLAPGEKIVCSHLANELEVSKTPIVNSLVRLESEGYVFHRKNVGYYVKEFDLKETLEMLQAREVLEVANVELVMDNCSRNDLIELEGIHSEFNALGFGKYDEERTMINRRFHLRLAEIGGNGYIVKMISDIYDQFDLRLKMSSEYLPPRRTEQAHVDHQEMIDALYASDITRLKTVMSAHLQAPARDANRYLKFRKDQSFEK